MKNYESIVKIESDCIEIMKNKGVFEGNINKWSTVNSNYDMDEYFNLQGIIITKIIGSEEGYFLKRDKGIMYFLEKELYKLFCTDTSIYDSERENFNALGEKIIPTMAIAISSKFGLEIAIATGISSIAVCGFLKIGKNIWCSYTASDFEDEDNESSKED